MDPKLSVMCFLLADKTVKTHIGFLKDVLVKVESFIFLVDFMILDFQVDFEVSLS